MIINIKHTSFFKQAMKNPLYSDVDLNLTHPEGITKEDE